MDVSYPAVNGPLGLAWGRGHKERAGFKTRELAMQLASWWTPAQGPQKVLDFVKKSLEEQMALTDTQMTGDYLSIPALAAYERVYRTYVLEKQGLLLKDGKPYGDAQLLSATFEALREGLLNYRKYLSPEELTLWQEAKEDITKLEQWALAYPDKVRKYCQANSKQTQIIDLALRSL